MDRQSRAALRRELTRAEDERERLTVVIAYLHERLKEADDDEPTAESPRPAVTAKAPRAKATGPYAGMTSSKASELLLQTRGQEMATTEIFKAITRGGVQIKDVDGLYKTLNRNAKFWRSGRGRWSLAAWRRTEPSADEHLHEVAFKLVE